MKTYQKITVRVAIGKRRYKEMEVRTEEAPAIRAVNRLIWRERDEEKRRKKQMEKMGISVCSLDELEEKGKGILTGEETALDKLIDGEERSETEAMIGRAMEMLTEKQREVVYRYFWRGETLRNIARTLGIHHSSAEEIYLAGLKKIKKFLKNFQNTPPRA